MKKTIFFLIVIVSVFAFGSAYAADSTTGVAHNGITAFDLGLGSASGNEATTEISMLSNGITYFGQRQPESDAKGYGAGGALPDSLTKKLYNGITVF